MNTSKNTFNKGAKMTKNRMNTDEPLAPKDYPNLVKRFNVFIKKKAGLVSAMVIVDKWYEMLREIEKE